MEKLFYQASKDAKDSVEESERLKIEIETFYGQTSRNYNNYVKESIFKYSIGELGYSILLESQIENYKRKHFKRILAHIVLYNKSVSDKLLNQILIIGRKEKIGITILEFVHLLLKNKIEFSQVIKYYYLLF